MEGYMEEKNFLASLDEYFSSKDTSDVIKDRYGNVELDMSWLFTEAFDRSVIKEALSKIMQRVNRNYVDNLSEGKNPEDIDKLVIGNYHGTPFIQVKGADDWTKLNITESGEKLFNLPTISVSKFEKAIAAVLSIQKINAGDEAIISTFVNNGCLFPDVTNVSKGMNVLADNLKSYFTYLYDLEQNTKGIMKTSITFEQRSNIIEQTGSKRNDGTLPHSRYNEIIPMINRIKCIESDRVVGLVNATEIDEAGNLSAGSIVYAIEKPLTCLDVEVDGTLFVCEPVEGNKSTRIMYIPKEEFDINSDESPDEHMGQIAKEYLEMSLEEFDSHENTVFLRHTSYETFKERIEFFIDGKDVKSVENRAGLKKLKCLYGNQDIELPYYKPRGKYNKTQIRHIIDDVLEVDATAQKSIIEENTKVQEAKT